MPNCRRFAGTLGAVVVLTAAFAAYSLQEDMASLAAVKARTGAASLANKTAIVVGGTSGSSFSKVFCVKRSSIFSTKKQKTDRHWRRNRGAACAGARKCLHRGSQCRTRPCRCRPHGLFLCHLFLFVFYIKKIEKLLLILFQLARKRWAASRRTTSLSRATLRFWYAIKNSIFVPSIVFIYLFIIFCFC